MALDRINDLLPCEWRDFNGTLKGCFIHAHSEAPNENIVQNHLL